MTNDVYQNFINKAHEFACGIYKQVPGALVPKYGDPGYKLIWDDLCYEDPPSNLPGLPPPALPPFEGGQCCDVDYKVVVRIRYVDGRPPTEVTFNPVYQGKILGILNEELPQPNGTTRVLVKLRWQKCDGRIFEEIRGQDNLPRTFYMDIVRVYPAYGVPDKCGNPPKKFPEAPPPPPEGYNSPPVLITHNDGDQNEFIFNLKPPTREKYGDAPFPPITVSVGGNNFDLDFDIDFNFGGSVSINKTGEGGSGLPSGFGGEFKHLSNGLGGVGNGVTKMQDMLDFNFAPPEFDTSPEVEKKEESVDDGGEKEEDEEGLLGVLVELTKAPSDVQFGTPNINFAGWFTFLVQGGYEPRNPIAFDKGYFPAPPGATGYALTFTKGAKGKVTVYSKKS